MLVTPQPNKRTHSSASFDSMVMKAARSAENISKDGKDATTNGIEVTKPKVVKHVKTETKSGATMLRKKSSQSLDVPERVPLRRSISDTETRILMGSPKQEDGSKRKNGSTISVSALLSPIDPRDNKKVTFSQVVDQMACSMSDSSSMSDLSCGATEDFKHNVNASSVQVIPPTRSSRTGRKLFRSKRKHSHGGGGGSFAPAGSNQLSAYFPRHRRKWGNTGSKNQVEGGGSSVSGSETNVYESSVDSLDTQHTALLTLRPLSAMNANSTNGSCVVASNDNNTARTVGPNKLHKLSSADSLFSMIRNLASSNKNTSTPSSPGFSDINDRISSGFPTPLTTPDTPTGQKSGVLYSPRAKDSTVFVKKKRESVPSSGSSSPASSPIRNQIMVEVVDPFNPRKDVSGELQAEPDSLAGSTTSLSSASSSQPTITLEVPAFSFGKCLSPIKELPSPMPTPLMSPVPFHHRVSVSSLGSHSSSPLGDESNFPNGICASCGGCGRSPSKSIAIAIVSSNSPGNSPGLSPSSSSSSSSDSKSNSSRRSRTLRKSYKNSKEARAALENAKDETEGGYSPGVSESIEMEEMSTIANTEMNNAPAAKNQPEFANRTIVEIPAQDIINAIESTSDGMSPMRRASYDSYEETTIVVPIAVVQRRPSLVATMDAERQERLRKEEKRKQSLSGTNQPSIPVITVTCDDSEAEDEEEDVSEYGFVPLEEYNTNSIQEDSLEINVTDYDVSVLEGIEDIPCVNIIPPSLPQSPHFEAYPEENFVINDDEVKGKEDTSSFINDTSSGDPSVLDGNDINIEEDDPVSISNLNNPCTFVVNKHRIETGMKMEAVVVELPKLHSTTTKGFVTSPGSADTTTTCSSTPSSHSSNTSPTSAKATENCVSPTSPMSSSASKRKRPPPLEIPNSNFLNFGPSPQETKNATMDTKSRPCSHKQKENETSMNFLMTSKELGERRTQTPTTLCSVETQESSSSSMELTRGVTNQIIPELIIKEQVSTASNGVTSKPINRNKQSLVKQHVIVEDADDHTEIRYISKTAAYTNEGLEGQAPTSPIITSPKFLIPRGKFDSTPRERSQSVQYTDPSHILFSHKTLDSIRSPTLQSTMEAKKHFQKEHKSPGRINCPTTQIVSLMIQPPTPCGSKVPGGLDNIAPNCRPSSKAVEETKIMFSPNTQIGRDKSICTFDFPSDSHAWTGVMLGSPPPMRKNAKQPNTTNSMNKPKSLDIERGMGPSITITPMSEMESDADSSPNLKDARSLSCFGTNSSPMGSINTVPTSTNTSQASGMQYLSPFPVGVQMHTTGNSNSRTASESNLSSSGYSSMASPGPSRSGSFNPICASESEDASSGTPTKIACSGGSPCFPHHFHHIGHYRPSSRSTTHQSCISHGNDPGI